MALMVTNPGQYVLGGLSAPSRGISEEFQAGLQANLGRQDARQVMRAREQAMGIAASQEARAQQQFEFQQQQARAAAAQAAARQRALTALTTGLGGIGAPGMPGAPGAGVAPTAPIAPVAPPRAGLLPPTAGRTPLSFGTAVPGAAPPAAPAAGTPLSFNASGGLPDSVQVASLDPMESFRLAFQERPDLFGGGVQVADASGGTMTDAAPMGQPERMFMTPESMATRAQMAQASGGVASPFASAPDQFVLTQLDTPYFVPGVGMVNYVQYNAATGEVRGPNGEAVDPNIAQQVREGASFNYAESIENNAVVAQRRLLEARAAVEQAAATGNQSAYVRALNEFRAAQAAAQAAEAALPGAESALRVTQPITSRGLFAEEGPGVAARPRPDDILPEGTPEPISDAAAAAETATTAEEAAPTRSTRWGGLQLSFGTPVELAFSTNNGRGSEAYVAAPENIYRDAEVLDRQRQRLTLLAQFYQQTGDVGQLVGVMNQLDELSIEQRYLDGMLAIVGIQRADFGALQALLQERYRGQEVEVRPYTDGTVEIFLDGQSEARVSWDQMATNLRAVYDRGYIEQQQALAANAREEALITYRAVAEAEAQAGRAIAEYESRQELDRALAEGELRQVSTEPPVYNMIVGGRLVPVTVEAVTEGAGRNAVTRYVVRRLDTTAVD